MTAPAPLLECRALVKTYPGVLAVDRVDFQLRPGEVHVLFGENGAGKSTLISLLAGAQEPTAGEICAHGLPVRLDTVHTARGLGISAVFQEFSLVPQLTVEENLFLGAERTRRGLLDRSRMREETRDILKRLGFDLRPGEIVQHLTRAEQQMVEIAKAFRSEPSVLILDEPTASLTERETERLFALLRAVTAQGVGVVYITHRMEEIRRIGDRVTVLRDGRVVATVDARSTPEERLVELMTGRVIAEIYPHIPPRRGAVVLRVQALTSASGNVRDASLQVRAGEVVGIAGLVGSGKSELARACFGVEGVAAGQVWLAEEEVTGSSPGALLRRGAFYLPPDRREEGLMMMRSCRENVALPALGQRGLRNGILVNRQRERSLVGQVLGRVHLHPLSPERDVGQFSGGNQQKVLLGKGLTRPMRLFVLDEPTVGVDVATRAAIYRFVAELCAQGVAILLVSSDLPEVLHLSHRLYVMHQGRVQAELAGPEISERNVLAHFFGRSAA